MNRVASDPNGPVNITIQEYQFFPVSRIYGNIIRVDFDATVPRPVYVEWLQEAYDMWINFVPARWYSNEHGT
jgi:hypothetical protein